MSKHRIGQVLTRMQSLLGYFVVLVFAALFLILPFAQQWEARWRDLEFSWLASNFPVPAANDIVVVGIDDEDLRTFGVPVAMLHRELGAFLETMALAKPRAIGLDVLLPSASFDKLQPGLDAALARGLIAAKAVTPVVLGISTSAEGHPRTLHPLFSALAGKDGVGYVFLSNDSDGVVRRFDERLGSAGESLPTLAGQIARTLGMTPSDGLINYLHGTPFSYVPLRQVLAWRAANDIDRIQLMFGAKVVLLGSVLAFDDQHRGSVPLSGWIEGVATSHGVLFHALQLRNLMGEKLVQPLPYIVQLVILMLLAASWWWRPSIVAATFGLALVLAIFVIALLLLRNGWSVPAIAWSVAVLTAVIARAGVAGLLATRERKLLRASFGGFVSPAVLDEILAGRLDPKGGGARLEICVMFSDIRGFTSLSEAMPPEQVTNLLNRYFELMSAAIHRHNGTLDKFMGDGLMAVFGAPKPSGDCCSDALAAGKAMFGALALLNQGQRQLGEPEISIGVGLHFGPATVGYVGSKDRFEYSAIGDTVNAASRVEGMSKVFGFPLVLSAAVHERLDDRSGLLSLGSVEIRGRSPMDLFGWKPHQEES